MAQNPLIDHAANQEAHMERVRASQRRGRLICLQAAFVRYRDMPYKGPSEEETLADVRRELAALEDEMRAAGQEP